MIGWVMSTFHLLHLIDVLKPQIQRSVVARLRAEGDATFRDTLPEPEELPIHCQEILRNLFEKVNQPAALIREPQKFTREELSNFPADLTDGPLDEEEGNPWDDVDVNEHEGPSVGKAKASQPPPSAKPAQPAPAEKAAPSAPAPKAALIGAPPHENVEEGTIKTQHAKGHVEEYRYRMEENVKGEVVEHVVVDSHPYELITRACWEMEAKDLPWPWRLQKHATKVNAITRGQPGRNVQAFDSEMWMDLEVFFKEFNHMLPPKVREPSVLELLSLLALTASAALSLSARLACRWLPIKG